MFDFLNTSAGVAALKEVWNMFCVVLCRLVCGLSVQPVSRYELENLAAGIAMLCERIHHMPSTTPLEMYGAFVCVYT